jgi:competence CoiA-like predicted nuclease
VKEYFGYTHFILKKDLYMKDNVALFAATMLHSATNTHFFHWSTDSFSKHMALATYYDEIVDLVDAYVEAFMGAYDKITDFPSVYHQPKDPIKYMESLQKFIKEARKDLPEDEQLCNLLDSIADLVDSTTYKLRFLK